MNLAQQIIAVELAALTSLLIVSAVMGVYAANIEGNWNSAQFAFALTFIFGTIPALVFGAPIYLLLLRGCMARWPYVLLLGVIPGSLALFFETSIGLLSIISGTLSSALTHLLCYRLWRNTSFEPKRLRGPP
ncbi:MAG: hypothetical protein ABIU05_19065 [Nitrospirales bacterium]